MSKNFKNNKMEISNFILFFHLILLSIFFSVYSIFHLSSSVFFYTETQRTEQLYLNYFKSKVFTSCFAVALVVFCSGICSTFVAVFPLLCPMFEVLFSGCVTFAVALVLAVDPLTSLLLLLTTEAVPMLPPLL